MALSDEEFNYSDAPFDEPLDNDLDKESAEGSESVADEAGDLEAARYYQRKARWYAVQVASGCEKRVKLNLEQRISTLDVANRIFQVEIPQTPAVKLRKDGTRQSIDEKVFPGYVLVRMYMDDEVWSVVKNTPHVINFVGAEQRRAYGRGRGHVKPMPLGMSEVKRIFKRTEEQKPMVKIDMAPGDKITVLSGPFKDFEGEVVEVSPERSKLKALLSIFGRDTPVELEFNQVEKES
jgi:transcriptional antiterminator NusG